MVVKLGVFGKTQKPLLSEADAVSQVAEPFSEVAMYKFDSLSPKYQNKNFSAGKLIFCSIYMRSKIFTLSTSAHESWNKSIKFVQF